MDNNIDITKFTVTNLYNALTNFNKNENEPDKTTFIDSETKTIETKEVGKFGRFINWLTGRENARLLSIVNTYIQILEEIGTEGNTDNATQDDLNNLTIKVNEIMLKIKPGSQRAKLEKQMRRMETASFYKISPKKTKNDENAQASKERLETFKEWAKEFKTNEKLFKGDNTDLTEMDMRELAKASRYNDFYTLLKDDKSLRTAFFKWTLRDGNSARTFILFPQLTDRISECALSPRYGHFNQQYKQRKLTAINEEKPVDKTFKPLKVVKKEDGKYKVEGRFKYTPIQEEVILDKKEVDSEKEDVKSEKKKVVSERVNLLNGKKEINMGTENDKVMVSIGDIFEAFKGKRKDKIGNFEMFNGAIHNWNSQQFGSIQSDHKTYTNISFRKDDWWNDMPAFETLSIEEAKAKFGGKKQESKLDGKNWGVYAVGARDSKKIDFGGNHGYKMILIPTEDGQHYNVYPIGTFTKECPEGLGMLAFLLNSVEADLRFDENVYYTHREKGGVLFEMSAETGKDYMDLIKRKLRISLKREGGVAFADKEERTEYTNKFIARRLREMDQYANLLIGKNINKNITIRDDYKKALENLYKEPKIDEAKLKAIIKNIIFQYIMPDKKREKELAKNFEQKIREDHKRLHFHLNQTKYMFQFTNKNCAWNVQEELEEVLGKESEGGLVPDLFSIDVTEMDPSNFLKYVVKFAKIFPGPLSRAVVRTVCRILGAGRSFEYGKTEENGKQIRYKESVKNTRFWKTAQIYSPANLIKKVKEDKRFQQVFHAVV